MLEDNAPLVSVIMGAYNIEHISDVDKSILSILNQTYSNFEFIICNDGSTDRTEQILAEYQKKDCRIKIISNVSNKGLAASLNHCLQIADGFFIARQDADDISDIVRLEKQVEFLFEHNDFSFVGSNVALWNENGIWGERIFPSKPKPNDFLFTMPFVHGSLLFRRNALDKVKAYRVSKETLRAEDYDMLMRMYAMGLWGANLQEKLYQFREDESAKRRRKYRYRIDEARVRYKGFKRMGLLPKGVLYVIKPLIVGLIPKKVLKLLKGLRNY